MFDHDIDVSEKSGVRYLHFGSDWIQGAMCIARPWSLELAYTREMMAGLLLHAAGQWPRKVLQIGLGAASLTRYIYKHLPDSRMTVVEINPRVVAAAQQFFKLPNDPKRLRMIIDDGADYMLRGDETFDYILVDGFDADARPGALDSEPFYQACRAHLTERGLLAVNLFGRSRGFKASVERIHKSFDGRSVVFPSCDSGNAIAFANAGEPLSVSLETMRERATALKADTSLDLLPTISRLQLSASCPDGILTL